MFTVDLLRLDEGINPLKLSFPGDIPFFRGLDVESAGDGVVRGTIDRRGDTLFLITAEVRVPVRLSCRRCLAEFVTEVVADLEIAAMRGAEAANGDEDVIPLRPRQESINLGDVVREHVLLNLPAHPLCGEGCRGLCPGCGADLNHEPCSCAG
jgi:uncharacterized protein